jgi:hypothetical protein
MSQFSEANDYTLLQFYSNLENESFINTPNRSLIISDDRKMGALYIQAHLEKKFSLFDFQWVARAILKNKFLIDPPNPTWRATRLELRTLDLGGLRFPIEAYNESKHDFPGNPPSPTWIIIRGLPYQFFKQEEFNC